MVIGGEKVTQKPNKRTLLQPYFGFKEHIHIVIIKAETRGLLLPLIKVWNENSFKLFLRMGSKDLLLKGSHF